MKQKIVFQRIFLASLFATTALSGYAQQQFTQITTKENRSCGSACTLLDVPDLNGNSAAIILVTPLTGDINPHPVGVYYTKVNGNWRWSIINLDAKLMNEGSKFNVQYFSKPDSNQFVHYVHQNNLNYHKIDTSYINHAGLNGNPKARFQYIVNGNGTNMYEVKFQYNAAVGKWYLFNTNHRELGLGIAYNIVIDTGGNNKVIK
ncbi:MAG: hypothetical protein ACHQF0_12875 [Chitinophagales bacterium]